MRHALALFVRAHNSSCWKRPGNYFSRRLGGAMAQEDIFAARLAWMVARVFLATAEPVPVLALVLGLVLVLAVSWVQLVFVVACSF